MAHFYVRQFPCLCNGDLVDDDTPNTYTEHYGDEGMSQNGSKNGSKKKSRRKRGDTDRDLKEITIDVEFVIKLPNEAGKEIEYIINKGKIHVLVDTETGEIAGLRSEVPRNNKWVTMEITHAERKGNSTTTVFDFSVKVTGASVEEGRAATLGFSAGLFGTAEASTSIEKSTTFIPNPVSITLNYSYHIDKTTKEVTPQKTDFTGDITFHKKGPQFHLYIFNNGIQTAFQK